LEAVNLLRKRAADFDLVLMDLQMPEMDGLTATRVLRGELGLRQLPVVAMTANASASDRQVCLDAGMNDHVGKPFDLDQLVAVLQRLRPHAAGQVAAPALAQRLAASAEAQTASAMPGEAREVRAAAHAAGVALDVALRRMAGMREVYARMLQSFVTELPDHLQAFDKDDAEQRARRLHTLKGVSATLGADRLAKVMEAAEPEAADARHPRVLDALLALTEAQPLFRRLLGALQEAAPATAKPQQRAASEAWRGLLAPLIDRLVENDAAALDELTRLRHLMPSSSYTELSTAVETFDFAAALQLVRSWALPT
jgi:CheY-like chemotaxis protein